MNQSKEHDLGAGVEVQREVTRIALAGVERSGFVLAGSGAMREHGVIDRPTEDVDLFTTSQDLIEFAGAVERVTNDLRAHGYQVEETRRAPQFARLHVRTDADLHLDVDLGVDWRENEPVSLDIGPVLSLSDAIGNKVSALYSRGEARDYLDVDAIRTSGRSTDEQLIRAAGERDGGFEVAIFVQQLDTVRRLQPAQVARYGIDAAGLEEIKTRYTQWAAQLRGTPTPDIEPDLQRDRASRLREESFPTPATEAPRQPPGPAPPSPPRRSDWPGPEQGIAR